MQKVGLGLKRGGISSFVVRRVQQTPTRQIHSPQVRLFLPGLLDPSPISELLTVPVLPKDFDADCFRQSFTSEIPSIPHIWRDGEEILAMWNSPEDAWAVFDALAFGTVDGGEIRVLHWIDQEGASVIAQWRFAIANVRSEVSARIFVEMRRYGRLIEVTLTSEEAAIARKMIPAEYSGISVF
jgi:hypothetical protein